MLIERWSQDQGIAYESARECITHMIALQRHVIEMHQAAGQPVACDQARIAELLDLRRTLRVTDDAEVARVRLEIGAEVRRLSRLIF